MKIFAYALRERDERKHFERCSKELGFTYDAISEYPSPDNLHLVKGFDGVSIITNPIDAAMLDTLKENGIRFLSTRSIGYDHIDVAYAYQIGMRVGHVTYPPDSVANYTIMMMLIACRNIPYIMKKANAQDFSLDGNLGRELSESTVGVIGTGNIGAAVVEHLQGFGCRILMNDPFEKEELRRFGDYTDLDTLLAESDIVTIHAPALVENTHMIGAEEFRKMKDDAIFVNAARGSLVDTKALIDALENGTIGFAALDTIENEAGLYYLDLKEEKLKNRERAILLSYPNVFLTPHMAFYTEQTVSHMVENSCRTLKAFYNNEETFLEVPH